MSSSQPLPFLHLLFFLKASSAPQWYVCSRSIHAHRSKSSRHSVASLPYLLVYLWSILPRATFPTKKQDPETHFHSCHRKSHLNRWSRVRSCGQWIQMDWAREKRMRMSTRKIRGFRSWSNLALYLHTWYLYLCFCESNRLNFVYAYNQLSSSKRSRSRCFQAPWRVYPWVSPWMHIHSVGGHCSMYAMSGVGH